MGPRRETALTCTTRLADGTRAVTTTQRKTFEPVPGTRVVHGPGADPVALIDRHRKHLAALADEGLAPSRLDQERLPEIVHEAHLRYLDFHIGRGVFVPMTGEELDRLCEPGDRV